MPDVPLPVFNGEPFTSLLGVMRFPNELGKAETYAAWSLARGPLRRLSEQCGDVDPAFVLEISERASKIAALADEVRKAEKAGTAVGAITAVMCNLIATSPGEASWGRAIEVAELHSQRVKSLTKISRSSAQKYRSQYSLVFHFWGAYYINNQTWPSDFGDFMTMSEIVLRKLREWGSTRGDRPSGDAFRSPFVATGATVKLGQVPSNLLIPRKACGRPPKPRP
jgi:hypothetical protein